LLHFAANSLQLCCKSQQHQAVLLQFAKKYNCCNYAAICNRKFLQFATKIIVAILLQFATKNCCKSCIKIATTPFLFVANCRQILLQIATNCNNYFCRKIAAICKQNMLQIHSPPSFRPFLSFRPYLFYKINAKTQPGTYSRAPPHPGIIYLGEPASSSQQQP